jgi:hypothetical protein
MKRSTLQMQQTQKRHSIANVLEQPEVNIEPLATAIHKYPPIKALIHPA